MKNFKSIFKDEKFFYEEIKIIHQKGMATTRVTLGIVIEEKI